MAAHVGSAQGASAVPAVVAANSPSFLAAALQQLSVSPDQPQQSQQSQNPDLGLQGIPVRPRDKPYGPIRRLLIANRGEIAVRIIRTCRALGITSIAVFSEADRDAPFVRLADESTCIGPAESLRSYLNIEAVIRAGLRMRADAVHPGYGFLSENGEFADACARAGLIFVGPDGATMNRLGNKLAVKQLLQAEAQKAGDGGMASRVPLIPGYNGQDQSDARLAAEAKKMGFPLLLKAAAGGGGKGMRVVQNEAELADAISSVKVEARNGFGNEELLIERYFQSCRHIEFQIFGDHHGNVVHFGERDCSLQRRHQKVIEESPSPFMTPELRARMGETAVALGKLCGYVGAGTVEFLVDERRNFYFLEVNTRLQVEHPVTELIQGLDFVALQIHIAEGKNLDTDLALTPDRHRPHPTITHAMECRIYAEDPANNFFPSTGRVLDWSPHLAPGMRYDSGVVSGSRITVHYDPMIAKVIAYGSSRAEVVQRLDRALQQSSLLGLQTNKAFIRALLADPQFLKGDCDTRYLDREYSAERRQQIQRGQLPDRRSLQDLALAGWLWEWAQRRRGCPGALRGLHGGWSNTGPRWTEKRYRLKSRVGAGGASSGSGAGAEEEVRLRYQPVRQWGRHRPGEGSSAAAPRFRVQFLRPPQPVGAGEDGAAAFPEPSETDDHPEAETPVFEVELLGCAGPQLEFLVAGGVRCQMCVSTGEPELLADPRLNADGPGNAGLELWVGCAELGEHQLVRLPRFAVAGADGDLDGAGASGGQIKAPMPCKVLGVPVKVGDSVEAGQVVLVLESMKMEMKVHAPVAGSVKEIAAKAGDVVEEGVLLLVVEPAKQ